MNKTAIKNFAVRARNKLIEDITQKSYELGITKEEIKGIETFEGGFTIKGLENSKTYKKYEIKQREKLISNIKEKGFDQTIEEVAYTWFNRFIALRFMEVNEYLPTGVRVLSSIEEGKTEPDIIKEALNIDFDLDEREYDEYKKIVYRLIDSNDTEDLYRYLLVKQCNQLGHIMPMVFEQISDYTELLLPNNLLAEGSVIRDLVESIDQEDYKDQVEIIGWMYQYYISEKKDEVFADLKKNKKITKENIPAATQLFTPKWIVKYMVENSLGRLWLESHPDEELQSQWKYYLEEAEQDPEVQQKLDELKDPNLNPEDITVLDPSMGSGHILVYAFDVLYNIYVKAGYSEREIPQLILEKNLYGLDIDDRAGQLAAFALMMKARSKNRRIFRRKLDLNICSIQESNGIPKEALEYFGRGSTSGSRGELRSPESSDTLPEEDSASSSRGELRSPESSDTLPEEDSASNSRGDLRSPASPDTLPEEGSASSSRGELRSPASSDTLLKDIQYLINIFHDAKEYGSILDVQKVDFDAIEERLEEIRDGENADLFELQYREILLEKFPSLVKQGRIMSEKYDVVCTNPPYMGRKGMNSKLKKYVDKQYPDSKGDLFAVFMDLDQIFLKENGFMSMINQHSWMFLSSYEKLRQRLIKNQELYNMLHLGSRAFEEIGGEVVQSTTYVMRKVYFKKYKGTYIRLVDYNNANDKESKMLEAKNNITKDKYLVINDEFSAIPASPIAYWVSDNIKDIFSHSKSISDEFIPKFGMSVGDGNQYIRTWHEVNYDNICFSAISENEFNEKKVKWNVLDKGGQFRKWYGNKNYVVNWENFGFDIKNNSKSAVRSPQYFFKPHISWTLISSGKFSARFFSNGFILDTASNCIYFKEDRENFYVLGLLNSQIAQKLLDTINPTLNFSCGIVGLLPFVKSSSHYDEVENLVYRNLNISQTDWDSFETSWDFRVHPLANFETYMENYYNSLLKIGMILERKSIYVTNLEHAYEQYKDFTNEQFAQLKSNEEELNRIFIDIYGLRNELTPEVEDKDITIRKADRERDIKSFISYAVGCMFGRYSLDQEGLIYAGGEFDEKWKVDSSFNIVRDNVLVIADDDYFEDDIVNRFIDFVKITFGEETLEENLDYIAETLGQKASETPRQTIRRYFLKDFYKGHVKTYQKRPIYWLFDSGKKNGFKALIYMHRYDSSTVARVRTDYLHKLQKMYEAEVKRLDILLESDLSPREKAAAIKKKGSINKQIEECRTYDQIIAHIANQKIAIDLDDGVKVNYAKFQGVEVPQGEGKKPLKANLLAKI